MVHMNVDSMQPSGTHGGTQLAIVGLFSRKPAKLELRVVGSYP